MRQVWLSVVTTTPFRLSASARRAAVWLHSLPVVPQVHLARAIRPDRLPPGRSVPPPAATGSPSCSLLEVSHPHVLRSPWANALCRLVLSPSHLACNLQGYHHGIGWVWGVLVRGGSLMAHCPQAGLCSLHLHRFARGSGSHSVAARCDACLLPATWPPFVTRPCCCSSTRRFR
jgi:hypothetical protein